MVKKILLGLGAILVVFLIVVARQPADFKITRSMTVSAPAAVVFAQVNDFQKWPAWSPWEKMDPAMTRTMGDPSFGTGAMYSWSGNDKVGQGKMTITESQPSERIMIKLEFLKPFAATNMTEFTFAQDGKETMVTWNMTGQNNFMAKAMCLFMDMDKMVGGDFEKGLMAMKTVSEAQAAAAPAGKKK